MTLIDGDKIVTAQLYDDEHEEFTEKKMSIIDYVNTYTDEGVTTADDILGRIRAEIEQLTIAEGGDDYVRKMAELFSLKMKVLQIIDRYTKDGE